jgi:DNA-binding transcriptional ArsR family regulator
MSNRLAADPASFELMLDFFKALANDGRLRILGLLLQGPHPVKELAARIQLKEPTVCHHLAALERIGLVERVPSGNSHFYSVREDRLRRLARSIFTERGALANAAPDEDQWTRRVLANYVDGDALRTIPASRKKRWAILKWLAGKFESGTRYRESEINKVLQRHYWDSATLRRELVGYRMLNRDRAIYWRQPESEWLRL